MALPFFFEENINDAPHIALSENTSRHLIQVLRFKTGEKVLLTDGKGKIAECIVSNISKKAAKAEVINIINKPKPVKTISIAISPIKNASRFEWFLEKSTEIGINLIIPMKCDHTEKSNYKQDRLNTILVSAMLQSKQCWLPDLTSITTFTKVAEQSHHQLKLIAHCKEETRNQLASFTKSDDTIILIGPEGDFSKEEIDYASRYDFQPVSLGNTTLRTETAGVVAAALLQNMPN